MASLDRDYLTTLPTELLLDIFAEVPISSFLDLTQTSRGLRTFIKAHAARLCNLAIQTRYAQEAKRLKLTNDGTWLVVAHAGLRRVEDGYEAGRSYATREKLPYTVDSSGQQSERPHFKLQLKLSRPGPMLLFFLEEGLVQLKSSRQAYVGVRGLERFLVRQNRVIVRDDVEDSGSPKEVRDREMLWYYGVQEIGQNTAGVRDVRRTYGAMKSMLQGSSCVAAMGSDMDFWQLQL
jgi:hypothetical protein